MTTYKPKLIEVALPLAAINAEAARDKSIRGHPQSLHRWWARRPLAAARAVIWASLVDDPSADDTLTQEQQETERQRLFRILERLIKWESANSPEVLAQARAEIERCRGGQPTTVVDPFGGGGAIPLEAQRLGLHAVSGDLNPVAVVIQKAMVEIPPRFKDQPPVHASAQSRTTPQNRAQGLAEDVELYGRQLRDRVWAQLGHAYPAPTTESGVATKPIAWIWARTIESPDPTWRAHVPLVSSWDLVKGKGKQRVWVEPSIDSASQSITYRVRHGGEPTVDRTVDRGGGRCLATGASMPFSYIREEFQAGRIRDVLLAIVVDGPAGRTYLSPTTEQQQAAAVEPVDGAVVPGEIFDWPGRTNVVRYGMETWESLFTPRQLRALSALTDELGALAHEIEKDARRVSMKSSDDRRLRDGGSGPAAYADAIVTYLAFAVSKSVDFNCTISSWDSTNSKIRNVFARQAIPMTWDYAECNILGDRVGSFWSQIKGVRAAIEALPADGSASVTQRDARALLRCESEVLVSTDPPYYDNICYADLSDFFYVWLKRSLSGVWPDEFATLATPKSDELIANRYRAGSKKKAEQHFETGMAEFMREVAKAQAYEMPATIYYAYKATETSEGEIRLS